MTIHALLQIAQNMGKWQTRPPKESKIGDVAVELPTDRAQASLSFKHLQNRKTYRTSRTITNAIFQSHVFLQHSSKIVFAAIDISRVNGQVTREMPTDTRLNCKLLLLLLLLLSSSSSFKQN